MNFTTAELDKSSLAIKIELAKSALAMPLMFHEGSELHTARQELAKAQAREKAAQAAWDTRIAPAKGWAPDPLAVQS